jgi:hypothetical protein
MGRQGVAGAACSDVRARSGRDGSASSDASSSSSDETFESISEWDMESLLTDSEATTSSDDSDDDAGSDRSSSRSAAIGPRGPVAATAASEDGSPGRAAAATSSGAARAATPPPQRGRTRRRHKRTPARVARARTAAAQQRAAVAPSVLAAHDSILAAVRRDIRLYRLLKRARRQGARIKRYVHDDGTVRVKDQTWSLCPGQSHPRLLQRVRAITMLGAGDTLVDVGSGEGFAALGLAATAGCTVLGVEVVPSRQANSVKVASKLGKLLTTAPALSRQLAAIAAQGAAAHGAVVTAMPGASPGYAAATSRPPLSAAVVPPGQASPALSQLSNTSRSTRLDMDGRSGAAGAAASRAATLPVINCVWCAAAVLRGWRAARGFEPAAAGGSSGSSGSEGGSGRGSAELPACRFGCTPLPLALQPRFPADVGSPPPQPLLAGTARAGSSRPGNGAHTAAAAAATPTIGLLAAFPFMPAQMRRQPAAEFVFAASAAEAAAAVVDAAARSPSASSMRMTCVGAGTTSSSAACAAACEPFPQAAHPPMAPAISLSLLDRVTLVAADARLLLAATPALTAGARVVFCNNYDNRWATDGFQMQVFRLLSRLMAPGAILVSCAQFTSGRRNGEVVVDRIKGPRSKAAVDSYTASNLYFEVSSGWRGDVVGGSVAQAARRRIAKEAAAAAAGHGGSAGRSPARVPLAAASSSVTAAAASLPPLTLAQLTPQELLALLNDPTFDEECEAVWRRGRSTLTHAALRYLTEQRADPPGATAARHATAAMAGGGAGAFRNGAASLSAGTSRATRMASSSWPFDRSAVPPTLAQMRAMSSGISVLSPVVEPRAARPELPPSTAGTAASDN